MQDELINSYMKVINGEFGNGSILNESKEDLTKSHNVKGANKPSDKPFGSDNDADVDDGNESDEFVKIEKPKEHKSDCDIKPKKVSESAKSSNPFDALYDKIVKENSFNFSTEEDNEIEPSDEMGELNLDDEPSDELGEDEDVDFDLEDGEESSDELSDDEEVDLRELVGDLKSVLDRLEKIVDSDEEIDDIEDIEDSDEDELDLDDELSDDEEVEFDSEESSDEEDKEPVKQESVKVTGLKKGANLKPFKGNIKKLQNKKAEVSENNPKPAKSKASTPSTGKGFDGVPKKISPTTGHNLMKASSHTVSTSIKSGKGLFDQ